MSFILDAQLREDWRGAYDRYRRYLEEVRGRMPPSAHELATSGWYFDFSDHRCPHDAWLQSITISESPVDEEIRERFVSIQVRLLGAYHDGIIEFHYPRVARYQLGSAGAGRGHQDWRYNEFRLSDEGHVIHEIEWCGAWETARWVIEAEDVFYRWLPRDAADSLA